jgi:tetrahydromethanopterin S-methyltransferase subunit G
VIKVEEGKKIREVCMPRPESVNPEEFEQLSSEVKKITEDIGEKAEEVSAEQLAKRGKRIEEEISTIEELAKGPKFLENYKPVRKEEREEREAFVEQKIADIFQQVEGVVPVNDPGEIRKIPIYSYETDKKGHLVSGYIDLEVERRLKQKLQTIQKDKVDCSSPEGRFKEYFIPTKYHPDIYFRHRIEKSLKGGFKVETDIVRVNPKLLPTRKEQERRKRTEEAIRYFSDIIE